MQPGDGFGTILAKEAITVDVIFQPERADNYEFELTCKTLIDRCVPDLACHFFNCNTVAKTVDSVLPVTFQ